MDSYETTRGPFFKGMIPASHVGIPWGFTEEQMPSLKGHTSIVTGANVGLGYWTAYHLAKAGDHVIMACRTPTKCNAAVESMKALVPGADVVAKTLDLSSFESIRSFVSEYKKDYSDLDSLILNAGVMVPPFTATKEGLELQIGTNHFGHHLLTKLLLETLETTAETKGSATVVAVSSAAHYDSYPEGIRLSIEALNDEPSYDRAKAYGQSKLANVLFAQELARRLEDKKSSVLVNSIHPGGVDTELSRHVRNAIKKVLGEMAADFFVDIIMPKAGRGLWHPREAALTQVYAAVGPNLIKDKISGKYFHPIARETKPDLHAFNMTLQTGLWEMTEAFIASH